MKRLILLILLAMAGTAGAARWKMNEISGTAEYALSDAGTFDVNNGCLFVQRQGY